MKLIVILLGLVSVVWAAVAPDVVSPYADQSRVDGRLSPTIGNRAINSFAYSYGAQGKTGQGHSVNKRSLSHNTHAAPALVATPVAVSHQSRVDVISKPAVASQAITKPLLAHAAPAVTVPSAVSHQSRVDVLTTPTVVTHTVAPINYAASHHSAYNTNNGYNGYDDYIDYYNSAPLA